MNDDSSLIAAALNEPGLAAAVGASTTRGG